MSKNKKRIFLILAFVVGPVVLALAAFFVAVRFIDPQMETTLKVCASAQIGQPLDARSLVAQYQDRIGEVRISNANQPADHPNVDLVNSTAPLPDSYDFMWSGPGAFPLRCFVEVREGVVKSKLTNRL